MIGQKSDNGTTEVLQTKCTCASKIMVCKSFYSEFDRTPEPQCFRAFSREVGRLPSFVTHSEH